MHDILSKDWSFVFRVGRCRGILTADLLSEIDEIILVESKPFIAGAPLFVIFVNYY